jgi:hypothetical protein
MNSTRTLIAFAALATLGGSAFAQATINHSKALSGSASPGDSAGYPVTISQPGHYKLTGNLVVPAGVIGVEITAKGVTLDLNGFSIAGPVTCTQDPGTRVVTCDAASASHHGVRGGEDVQVRNGEVRGFAGYGIYLRSGAVENVTVQQNATYGISVEQGRVSAAISKLNYGIGIIMTGGLIERSVVHQNGGFGLVGSMVTTAVDSNVFWNRGWGAGTIKLKGVNLYANKSGNRNGSFSLGGNADNNTVF